MIDFCNRSVYLELTVIAERLGYLTSEAFTGGLVILEDLQLKNCIAEHVKAMSVADFSSKIKQVHFHMQDKDEHFVPDAMSFPKLLTAALFFTHNFTKILQLISMRADPRFTPPLYKEGKTLGLIDYYLASWPNDTGNALYARMCVVDPSLRVKETFPEFTTAFLKTLEPYRTVKQEFDDLNAVLKRRETDKKDRIDRPSKPTSVLTGNRDKYQSNDRSYDRHRFGDRFRSKPPYKKTSLQLHDDTSQWNLDEANEIDEAILELSNPDESQEIVFEPLVEPEDFEEDEEKSQQDLKAMATPGSAPPKPCWWKFANGNCTNTQCRLDHSEAAMAAMRAKRIQELAMSPFGPKEQDLVTQFAKERRDNAQKKAAQTSTTFPRRT